MHLYTATVAAFQPLTPRKLMLLEEAVQAECLLALTMPALPWPVQAQQH